MKTKIKYIIAITFVMALTGCNNKNNDSVESADTTNQEEYVTERPAYMDSFILGYEAEDSSDYETAISSYELAIEQYEYNENNEIFLGDIEGHLADCYYVLGEYNTAIAHYENAYSALENESSQNYMDYFLVNEGLGDSYLAISEYVEGKYYYMESLKYYDMAEDKYGYNETYILYKIAQVCEQLGEYDEASKYANQVINYDKNSLENENAYINELIETYTLLAKISSDKSDYENALLQLDNAMELAQDNKLDFAEAKTHFIKADTYNSMGDVDNMVKELELSESMCEDILESGQDANTIYLKLAIEMYRSEILGNEEVAE